MNNSNSGYEEQPQIDAKKSIRGYQVMIAVLAVVLLALTAFLAMKIRQQGKDNDALEAQKVILQQDLSSLSDEFDGMKMLNDSMALNLNIEKLRADSLLSRLQKERNISYSKLKEYETRTTAMRSLMESYMKQIDSLDRLNRQLSNENVDFRRQVAEQTLRAEKAEEKIAEQGTQLRQGGVIKARGITLTALNKNGNAVSRAGRAERLKVDFTLLSNEIAQPGERTVYVRITSPEGYLLATSEATFMCEGTPMVFTASRDVDYQNEDLAVAIYYSGDGISDGTYKIEVYADGLLIGSSQAILK